MAPSGNGNGITIPGRILDRLLLVLVLFATGGSNLYNGSERDEIRADVIEVCGEIQEVREELATLFEPFLDFPSNNQAQHNALQRIIDRLRAPHRCP